MGAMKMKIARDDIAEVFSNARGSGFSGEGRAGAGNFRVAE